MRRVMVVTVLLAVCVLALGTGCYTVLRHPTGSDIVAEGTYYRSCADCHADASFYHPYGNPYYTYGRSQYGWDDYYGQPWWYDSYWWDGSDHYHHGDDGYDYDGPQVETGERHLWSPQGWAMQGFGFSRPDQGSNRSPSNPPEQPREQDKKKDEKKKEEKKTEGKDERSLWDTPKRGF
jgi:hypothetical protein